MNAKTFSFLSSTLFTWVYSMFQTISRDDYRVLHPRPVYLIVSGGEGKYNVMAASWVTPLSEEPSRLGLAIDRESYTYELIHKYREFTVNVVDPSLVNKVWYAGTRSGRREDKIKSLELKLYPSSKISVPGLLEALAFIECRVVDEVHVGEVALFIADMVEIHVKPEYYDQRRGWNLRKAQVLMHISGKAFSYPARIIYAK